MKKGFTLIELMIVVAIIGILAAIAIPNFLRMQAKAKQSEAKSNLTSIHTAQVAYMSEGTTFGELGDIGWAVEGKAKQRYDYYMGDEVLREGIATGYTLIGATCNLQAASAVGFTAAAIGQVDGDAFLDEWYMTDDKVSANEQNDINS